MVSTMKEGSAAGERRGEWLRWRWISLGGLVALAIGASLLVGDRAISLPTLLATLAGGSEDGLDRVIVWQLRLPRALGAALLGSALAVGGVVMQGIFRNALADPGLIGVSAGGAAGAVGFLVLGAPLAVAAPWLHETGLVVFPIVGGTLATLLVYRLGKVDGRTHVATLLLVGIAVNALAGALVGLAIFVAPVEALRDFAFWSLGSLSRLDWAAVTWLAVGTTALLAVALPNRTALNLLLLGEAEAAHLGLPVERVRRWLILAAAAAVSLTVAFAGIIGFVGLVVPHLCRLLLGPDHRRLLPAAALAGAALLPAADALARVLSPQAELPIGVITTALGAPFFLWLVHRSKFGDAS